MTHSLMAVEELSTLREQVAIRRAAKRTIAFVPTMGALHDGHLSLVRLAKSKADTVIASIFVNPTQFAPGEDYEAYPRDTEADLAMLESEGVDVVYLPTPEAMYHDDHSTSVIVSGVGDGLETNHRPTFFHGVALVVLKLLIRVQPDIAIFGEKDYQQLAVIRRMVRDLDIPVEIIGAPIARDGYGLALSSRNRYFDETGLNTARRMNRIMFETRDSLENGETVEAATMAASDALMNAGFSKVDYVSVASADSLRLLEGPVKDSARLLIAAHCHGVRLIDNCAVEVG